MIETIITTVLFIFIAIYYLSHRKYNYWEKRKIPFVKPTPFLGNYGEYILLKKFMGHVHQSICEKFPNAPYIGAFFGPEPTLVVQDPEIIKLMFVKDFYYFNGREITDYTHKEVITQNMFFTYGDRWKLMRQNLSPIFSSSKMKNMFHLVEKTCHNLQESLDRDCKKDNVMEIRPLMARYTMDAIGSCVFGIETETLTKGSKDNPFTLMGTLIFLGSFYRGLKLVFRSVWPGIFYGLGMKCFPSEADPFFFNLITGVLASRQYKPTDRNDFVDLMLKLKQESYVHGDSVKNLKGEKQKISLEFDDDMLVALSGMLFAAGFETSSTTLQYTFYELAKNIEVQKRVIHEVDEYLRRHNNKLGYESQKELMYTDACVDETLRLHPPAGWITREVMDNYTMPCGAVLEKGVRVHIPVYALHHNANIYPEPEEFRPERFLGEEKRNINPYTYLPFGEGHRICLGLRFAKMQLLAGIVTVLKKYQVELADGTPRTLELTPTTFVTQPKDMIKLKFVEREGWQQRIFV